MAGSRSRSPGKRRSQRVSSQRAAPGAGIDFAAIAGLNPARALELRLVKDNVIHGKIVDTQGKPVAGVQVAVTIVGVSNGNSADRFLSAWTNRMYSFLWPEADRNLWQEGGAIAPATTDAEGRFTLAGTGAERLVHLHTSGAGSAAADWRVVNRPGLSATPYNETAQAEPDHCFGVRSSARARAARAGTRLRG